MKVEKNGIFILNFSLTILFIVLLQKNEIYVYNMQLWMKMFLSISIESFQIIDVG